MERVIFACVHNAGRSQIAAAFFSRFADPTQVEAISAGTNPGERGIDLSRNSPQRLTDELARSASLLITMGCGDECPYVPGLERDDWPFPDPKGRPIDEVRRVRDEIRDRVSALVDAHHWRRAQAAPHS